MSIALLFTLPTQITCFYITMHVLSLLLPTGFALQAWAMPRASGLAGKAIYLISNDQSNNVVALPIDATSGMVSAGTCTATGGAGSNSIDGSTNQPAAPDALISQSALTLAGNVRV